MRAGIPQIRAFVIVPVAVCLIASLAAATERMAVVSNVANIRNGPKQDAVVLWQVEKFYPLNILEKKGEWIRFQDFEGDQGWVHASLLGKISTVIAKSNQCNIRKGPGTQFDVAFSVDKGIPFKVLQTRGMWIEVEHADGDKGWIFKDLVW